MTLRECQAKWGFFRTTWDAWVKAGLIASRDKAEYKPVLDYIQAFQGREMTPGERSRLKAKLLREGHAPNECAECHCEPTWNGKPLNFHLDHKDGDNTHNALANLRLLCPNCHSQPETYGWRNKAYRDRKEAVAIASMVQARH